MKLPFRRGAKPPPLKTPDDRMTLTEHLAELRTRIIRSMLAITIGIIVILASYNWVLRFLQRPYEELCKEKGPDFCDGSLSFFGPLEGFSTRLSISTYGGIILAMPVLMWQLWRFIVPALHAKEKRYAVPFVVSTVLLFLLGAFLAYMTLGKALDFLISWAGDDVNPMFRVSDYVRLVGLMAAAFGVAFQFPVLLVFLQLVGVITPQTLIKGWRYAILTVFVIAAVITPSGDPYSMLALAIPMTLFYFFAVLIGYLVQRRRNRTARADA